MNMKTMAIKTMIRLVDTTVNVYQQNGTCLQFKDMHRCEGYFFIFTFTLSPILRSSFLPRNGRILKMGVFFGVR